MQLAYEKSVGGTFYTASHIKLNQAWHDFFEQAQQHQFIQTDDPQHQTELMVSLLGMRHHKVLLA